MDLPEEFYPLEKHVSKCWSTLHHNPLSTMQSELAELRQSHERLLARFEAREARIEEGLAANEESLDAADEERRS